MTRTADWHAQQYTKFEDERTRAVRDLVSAVPRRDVRVAAAAMSVSSKSCASDSTTARFPSAVVSGEL